MPWCKCPICGETYQRKLQGVSLKLWYKLHKTKVGKIVKSECPDCLEKKSK